MEVSVTSRSGKDMGIFPLSDTTTLTQFKSAFAEKFPKYDSSRQWYVFLFPPVLYVKRFTMDTDKGTVLKEETELLSKHVKNGKLKLVFKDLGMQIAWTTVFLLEYLGPLLIHPCFYYFPEIFYPLHVGSFPDKVPVQTVAMMCVVFHFVKRELETLFIHRFSAETMPFTNVFKNCAHYWMLNGVFIAYFVYHPLYTPPEWVSSPVLMILLGVFMVSELNNFNCHVILRDLRPAGTKKRGIPMGNLFKYVSCANYTWELLIWLVFALFTQALTSYIFFVVSFVQIYLWSLKKHSNLRKEFGDKYPRRKVLIPFIL